MQPPRGFTVHLQEAGQRVEIAAQEGSAGRCDAVAYRAQRSCNLLIAAAIPLPHLLVQRARAWWLVSVAEHAALPERPDRLRRHRELLHVRRLVLCSKVQYGEAAQRG